MPHSRMKKSRARQMVGPKLWGKLPKKCVETRGDNLRIHSFARLLSVVAFSSGGTNLARSEIEGASS